MIRACFHNSIFASYLIRVFVACFCLAAPLSGYTAEQQLTVYAELEEAANLDPVTGELIPIGPGHKIVVAVLARAGFEADVRVVPWTRVIRALDSQANILGISMTRTPSREDQYHWIGLIRPINVKLWALPERANEFPEALEDALDYRISAIREDVVERYLLGRGFRNLVYISENSNTLTMMRRDRVDLMPYIESGIESYLERKNEPPDVLVPIYDLEEISTGHYIVMSKNSDPELVKLLQDSYQAVVDSGEFDSIIKADGLESN